MKINYKDYPETSLKYIFGKWFEEKCLTESLLQRKYCKLLLEKNLMIFYKDFNEECPICLVDDEECDIYTICNHKFHERCLYKWFVSSNKLNCPYCTRLLE